MTTMQSAYLFECKGIQRYIFGSGRQRQVIGASDLIAGIARSDGDDDIGAVFRAVGMEAPELSRRAGASFCAHAGTKQELEDFRRLWRLVAGIRYPGLEFSDVEPASADTALEASRLAYSRLTALRENSSAFLPPTGHPFLATNPRTGLVAVARADREGNELLDAVGAPAHRHSRELADSADDEAPDRLAADFLPPAEEPAVPLRFPRHFDTNDATARNPAFPFPGRDRRIGVVHADLSGLGQVFQSLMARAGSSRDIFEVATAIEDAVVAAARSACADVLLPEAVNPSCDPQRLSRLLGERDGRSAERHPMRIVPARPVLLGGDDITVVVRADLAIAFAERFLLAVESETREKFSGLRKKFTVLPERLSACAGVCIVSAGHPFIVAERLAEGLCDSAKARAKSGNGPYPSYLDFAVVTSMIDESLPSWRSREQTIPADEALLETFAGPRRICGEGAPASDDCLGALLAVARLLAATPGRGKLLEALGLRHESKFAAGTAWDRFWKVAASEKPDAEKQLREALAACLSATLTGDAPDLDESIGIVSDALELIDIGAVS